MIRTFSSSNPFPSLSTAVSKVQERLSENIINDLSRDVIFFSRLFYIFSRNMVLLIRFSLLAIYNL